MKRKIAMAGLTVAGANAQAADRFPILTQEQLTPDQGKFVKQLLAGPRGGGDNSAAAVDKLMANGPFNAWARSPDLGDRLQKVGEYIRFNSSIPLRLNEFAILITARHWTSQYEWFAHLPLGLKAGLDPKIAAELAQNQRPSDMRDGEAVVYDFVTEYLDTNRVATPNYKRAVDAFGEQGVVDLVGVCGYYMLVSMTLNVADVKLPLGEPNPLPPLK